MGTSKTNKQRAQNDSSIPSVVTVLIIYNIGASQILINSRSGPACPKHFIFAHSHKIHVFSMDCNTSYFHENSPQELSLTFLRHVPTNINGGRYVCCTSLLILIFFFVPSSTSIYKPRSARPIVPPNPIFTSYKKTYYETELSLRILTKHMVRLRCRCSCKIDRTSAVPLLEICETSVKPS
jgi:hypothetical protein